MNWERHAESWPHAEHSRFITASLHRWHVQQMGQGPLILLLHGAGGSTQSWRNIMPLLARDHHVIAVDLPGQGFTRLGAQQRCGLPQMSEDLLALCTSQGWQPEAIVGHSAGVAIALQMALHMNPPPRIIGLNAALGNFRGLAGVLFPLMAKALALTPGIARLFTASTARPGSVERLIAGTGSNLPAKELQWYRALISNPTHVNATLAMMAQWDLTPLRRSLPAHRAEALFIATENDRTVPVAVSREVAKEMPDASAVILPDLGHLAHEEDAETILSTMQPFLGKLR
jgi:magnesium chelatase accessory protein